MSYRPICDTWILARSKTKYYGAFPAGFLGRARALLGVGLSDPVLHVCGGRARDYPYVGFGPNDKTLDLDPALEPDFLHDAREPLPSNDWPAILIDRPYTLEDAEHYAPGAAALPSANLLIKHAIAAVRVGGKVGILDYVWPMPPKNAKEVAVVLVTTGRNNRARFFVVFERLEHAR